MGKIYKGWELMKAIAEGEIKEGSRFKAEYETFIVRAGYLFVEYDDGQEYANSFELAWDFELIEDKIADEIDIDEIEELTDEKEGTAGEFSAIKNKMNEILQAVKQIDKRVKKLEEK